MNQSKLELYEFRAVYYAAGPAAMLLINRTFGTASRNPSKSEILDADFDRIIEQAASAIPDTNANFAIIPFDLGFPPEEAEKQKEFFKNITEKLSNEGVQTLAMISVGARYSEPPHKTTDWTALSPSGKIVWHNQPANIAMTCWSHPGFKEYIADTISSAMKCGASGVFLDSVIFGAAPMLTGSNLLGAAGCHCRSCNQAFQKYLKSLNEKPFPIPKQADLNSPEFIDYAVWRASVVSSRLDELMERTKNIEPSSIFAVSAPMLTYLPTLPMFGLDPEWVLSRPDVCCIEHNRAATISKEGLTYCALSLKTLYASTSGTLVAELGWRFGPSKDLVQSSDEFSSSMGADFSQGVAPVIRIGEYRDVLTSEDISDENTGGAKKTADVKADAKLVVKNPDNSFDVITHFKKYLTGREYSDRRNTISALYNWIEKNPDIFEDAVPVAKTGLLFSWNISQWRPGAILPIFHQIIQTLTEVQIPARILPIDSPAFSMDKEVKVVIVPWQIESENEFNEILEKTGDQVKFVFVGNETELTKRIGVEIIPSNIFADVSSKEKGLFAWLGKRIASSVVSGSPIIYGGFPISLRAGIPPPVVSDFPAALCRFQPPKKWELMRDPIVRAMSAFPASVETEAPPYIHTTEWKKGTSAFFHIVNILPGFPGPDFCNLKFPAPVNARVIHPERNKIYYHNTQRSISVRPTPYAVVEVKNRYKKEKR